MGGTLIDTTPDESGTVDGASYVQQFSSNSDFKFNKGVQWGRGNGFEFAHFEALALNAIDYSYGGTMVRAAAHDSPSLSAWVVLPSSGWQG